MARCSVCGEQIDMPRRCSGCGGRFCPNHRLPENHTCIALGGATTHGPDFREFQDTTEGSESADQSEEPEGHDPWKDWQPKGFPNAGADAGGDDHRDYDTVDPGTVGTAKEPSYEQSPPVEVHSNEDRSDSPFRVRVMSWLVAPFILVYVTIRGVVGALISGKGVVSILLLAAVLSGGVATGDISTSEYIGPPGEELDRSIRAAVFGNGSTTLDTYDSTRTATATPASGAERSSPAATATDEDDGGFLDSLGAEDLERSGVEELVHEEINERREAEGLSALAFDDGLRDIARYHSNRMAERDELAHTLGGQDLADRYDRFDYDCRVDVDDGRYATGAENVLYTYYDENVRTERGTVRYETQEELATGIVNQWMNSTGHRENVLRPYWNDEGIGITIEETDDGMTRIWATQNFC